MRYKLKTKGWVERMILQELSEKDRRYTHNYRSKDCRTLDLFSFYCFKAEKEDIDNSVKTAVRRALNRLRDKELVNMLVNPKKRDKTAVWEIRKDGLREVKHLNKRYREKEEELRKKYGLKTR